MSYLARLREKDEAAEADSAPSGGNPNGICSVLAERLAELRRLPSPPAGARASEWTAHLAHAESLSAAWGDKALALGWTVDDLLGVDPRAWMRLDRRGVFLLNDQGDVLGLSADVLVMRVDGAVLRCHRRRVG